MGSRAFLRARPPFLPQPPPPPSRLSLSLLRRHARAHTRTRAHTVESDRQPRTYRDRETGFFSGLVPLAGQNSGVLCWKRVQCESRFLFFRKSNELPTLFFCLSSRSDLVGHRAKSPSPAFKASLGFYPALLTRSDCLSHYQITTVFPQYSYFRHKACL